MKFRTAFKCLGIELPPLSILYVHQKHFCTTRNGLGTSLEIQCHAGSGFPCKVG